jgi:hypothetical protein
MTDPNVLLLIDDDSDFLAELKEEVKRRLQGDGFVETWSPSRDEKPRDVLDAYIQDNVVLVVTDDDLTGNGLTGLFGATVVDWCQRKQVPVAIFSRRLTDDQRPDLFDMVVSASTAGTAAEEIVVTFEGFVKVWEVLSGTSLTELSGPAEAAAVALGDPQLESELALYTAKLFAANSVLGSIGATQSHDPDEHLRLLVYVVGHILRNVVLPYPGPIIGESVLGAYLCTTTEEAERLSAFFEEAGYIGPFAAGRTYWRDKVDDILASLAEGLDESTYETFPQFCRAIVERRLGRELARHECERCGGEYGGFFCPFTVRAVCRRDDCSVDTNSWIPQAADLTRTEREYFDEWQSFLGF